MPNNQPLADDAASLPAERVAVRADEFMQASVEGLVFFTRSTILDCNDATQTLLGRSRESLCSMSAVDLFAPQDRPIVERHMFLGLGIPYLAKIPKPDGSEIELEITGRPWVYAGQDCWVSTLRTTTGVSEVTQSLVRSQARYRTLVENADQVILFEQNRQIAYANPSAAKFFKLEAQKLRGVLSLYVIHPDDRALALMRRKEMISGDPDRSVMLRTISPPTEVLMPDSKVSWVRFYGALIEWDDRPATLIFMTDLTAQHETEQQMRRALAQEKELGDLKTRFVSMASHEFRTPLSTIQTSSELLQHYSERLTAGERYDAISDIQNSVQRMQVMMENFLAFGRLSANAMQCSPTPMALLQVVRSVVAESLAAHGQGHKISIALQDPVQEDSQLLLDAMLLRQILGNLLGNACKYSPADKAITLRLDTVQLAAQPQLPEPLNTQTQLRMVVTDHGMGIPPDDIPLLFGSFHRAANAGHIPGTGLGLAIVDRAARAHGGQVSVRSQLGQGAEFEVLLPWQQRLPS
jgi:PAS domain S-box-containing protein